MADVTGKTSVEIDNLLKDLVISAEITAEGQLLLTTKGGSVVNVGPVGASDSQIGSVVDGKIANVYEQIDDADALAASKAEVTIANVPPTSPAAGDLWYDTSTTPPSAKMWDGDSWEPADAAAQSLANTAKELANVKAVVTVGPNIPASAAMGDIWYDTALTPTKTFVCKLPYASGGSLGVNFTAVEDPVAQDIANSKSTGTVGPTAPTSPNKGDSWTDTSLTPNATFTWSGAQWIADDATAQAIAETKASSKSGPVAPTNPSVGDLWYDTSGSTPQAKVWGGAGWNNVDANAASSAQLAYELASSRVQATIDHIPPQNPGKGDIWYDTTTTPSAAKVWDGSAWGPADAATQAKADQALSLAESSSTVIVDSVSPTAPNKGDIWYDTSTTPAAAKIWNGSAWAPADSSAQAAAASASSLASQANTLAGGKAKITVSGTAPTTKASGDIWYDTATTPASAQVWNGTAWVAADSAAKDIATQAGTLAGSKAKATVSSAAPTSPSIGDLWYDISTTPASAKMWDGAIWAPADSAAQNAAATASTLAGTKAKVTVSSTAPTSPSAGDMWVNTSTTPAPVSTWSGSAWVAVDAVSQAIAAGKATVSTSSTMPTKASLNDVWNDTSVTPQVTRICTTAYTSGGTVASNWAKTVSDAVAQTIANGKNKTTVGNAAPSSPATGDMWVDITLSPAGVKTWNGTAWVLGGDATAQSTATAAQTAANAKATVVVASTQPTTHATGDIWYDTSTTPAAAKMWNGTAYVAADSAAQNAASLASTAASNASTLAGTKAKITVGSTIPASAAVGDIWYDTALTPNVSYTCSTAYASSGSIASNYKQTDAAAASAASTASTLAGTKAKVTVNTSAPSSPATGDIWYNTSTTPATVESWNGSSWVVSGDTTARTSASSKATITVGSSAPSTKQTGDLWYDTSTTPNAIKTWNGSAWVSADSAALASAGVKGRIYSQPDPPSPVDMNGLWIDTDAGNKVYHGSRRAIYYGFTRTGSNIPGRMAALGWEVTQVDTMPTLAQAEGYDLLVLDAQVWAATGDYQSFFNAGLSIFTTGNDTLSIAGMFSTTVTSDYTVTPTHPYPGGMNPIAVAAWQPYTDTDNLRYLGGLDASAVIVGSNLIGTTEQPMIIAKEGSLGQRWVHCQTASSYTPLDAMTAIFTWLTTWVPSQDAAILAAQTTANSAQGVANNANTKINQLVTGDLTVEGVLNVNLQIAKSLILNKGSGAKNSIIIDPDLGIQISDPTGSTFIELPTDPSKSASFNGDVTASSITAEKTTLHGTDNEVVPAASLTLSNAVSPPKTSPIAATTPYNMVSVPGFTMPATPSGSSMFTLGSKPRDSAAFVGQLLWTASNSNYGTTYKATVYSPNLLTTAVSISTVFPANVAALFSVAQGGYLMASAGNDFVMIDDVCFLLYDRSIYRWTHGYSTAATVFPQQTGESAKLMLGTDGTNLYYINSTATCQVFMVSSPKTASTMTGTLIGTLPSAANDDYSSSFSLGGLGGDLTVGKFDRAVKQLRLYFPSTGSTYYLNASTLADITASNPTPYPGNVWDPSGSRFYNYYSGTLASKFSKNLDTTPIWVAYTWRNPNNGDHETVLGPPVQLSVNPYWGISVTRPTPPTSGTTGDVPQTARIYAARGTTQPASTAFREFLEDDDVSTNMISFDLTFGTTAPPTVGEFPTGTPGLLESEAGGFVVRGDGTGAWPGLVPIGTMNMYMGQTDPAGWFICDGRYLSRTQYADLYNVLKPAIDAGYIGQGDGSTTFNLPDMAGRVGVGLDPNGEAANVTHIGERGGEETHLLTANESGLRSHNHSASGVTDTEPNHTHGGPGNYWFSQGTNNIASGSSTGRQTGTMSGAGAHNHSVSVTVNSSSALNAAEAHNNMQPYMGVNYIIKY